MRDPDWRGAIEDPDVRDHALVRVVFRIEDESPQRLGGVPARRRYPLDYRLQDTLDALAVLGRRHQYLVVPEPECLLHLFGDALRFGHVQVDLVDDRDDLQVMLDGEIDVGKRLGLDTLGRVHYQERPLARGQAAGNLVGEVDVAWRVDQVELIALPRSSRVVEPNGLGLYGDAALPLELHRIEVLLDHLPRVDGAGDLQQAVGKRRLAVVYVSDDAEVADVCAVHHPMVAYRAPALW